MKEILDIRVGEDWAKEYLGPNMGEPLSPAPGFAPVARRFVLESRDPLVSILKGKIDFYENATGRMAPCSVLLSHEYDHAEFTNAQLFRLVITKHLNFYGEEYGTVYDCSRACPRCAFGRVQVSPLMANCRKIPKKLDIGMTICPEEIIVSERIADAIIGEGISGCELREVVDVSRRRDSLPWYQLIVTELAGVAVGPTRFGIDFFRDDAKQEYVCKEHMLSGLHLLSELSIARTSCPQTDIAKTINRTGKLAGWVVPASILLISRRFAELLQRHVAMGYELEAVHLVD